MKTDSLMTVTFRGPSFIVLRTMLEAIGDLRMPVHIAFPSAPSKPRKAVTLTAPSLTPRRRRARLKWRMPKRTRERLRR